MRNFMALNASERVRARGVVNFKTASHCRCVIIKSWSERVLCDKFAADVILGFCERVSARAGQSQSIWSNAVSPRRATQRASLSPKLEMRLIHAIKSVMALEIIHSVFGAPTRSRHKNDAIDRRCNWWLEIGQVLHSKRLFKTWQDGRWVSWSTYLFYRVHLCRLWQRDHCQISFTRILLWIYLPSCEILSPGIWLLKSL